MIRTCPECGYKIRIQLMSDDTWLTTNDGVMAGEFDYECPKCHKPQSVAMMVGYEPVNLED